MIIDLKQNKNLLNFLCALINAMERKDPDQPDIITSDDLEHLRQKPEIRFSDITSLINGKEERKAISKYHLPQGRSANFLSVIRQDNRIELYLSEKMFWVSIKGFGQFILLMARYDMSKLNSGILQIETLNIEPQLGDDKKSLAALNDYHAATVKSNNHLSNFIKRHPEVSYATFKEVSKLIN